MDHTQLTETVRIVAPVSDDNPSGYVTINSAAFSDKVEFVAGWGKMKLYDGPDYTPPAASDTAAPSAPAPIDPAATLDAVKQMLQAGFEASTDEVKKLGFPAYLAAQFGGAAK